MTVKIPNHVAIVMDGNGRWAQKRGLPRTAGHEAGEAALFDVVEGAITSQSPEERTLVPRAPSSPQKVVSSHVPA